MKRPLPCAIEKILERAGPVRPIKVSTSSGEDREGVRPNSSLTNQQQEPEPPVRESGPPLDIWVDDCKPAPNGCAVARTYDIALRMLRRYEYATLYLDHDLGEERTGYDLLMALIRENRVPPRVECISWNPVGRQRIAAALLKYRDVA